MDYDTPTPEQLESVVDSEESDQLDGDEEGTSEGEGTDNDADDETNADDTGGEDTGGEDESGDEGDGSDGDDTPGEDAGDDDVASESKFKHGEKEYEHAEVAKIIDEHTNNANWTKTNTEKAQAIANQADQIKAVLPLLEKVAKDDDALDLLQELTGFDLDKTALEGLKAVAGMATPDGQPTGSEVVQAENTMLRFQLNNEEFRNDPAKFAEFIQFNVDHKAQSIEQAHTLWKARDADSRIKAAEEATVKEKERADAAEKAGKGKKPPPAPTGRGAKKLSNANFKPSKDGTYDDATNHVKSMIKDVFD